MYEITNMLDFVEISSFSSAAINSILELINVFYGINLSRAEAEIGMGKKKRKLKFTVGAKLMVSFISVLLLLVVSGVLNSLMMTKINDNTKVIADKWLVGVETINNINYMADHVLSTQYKILIEQNENLKKQYTADADAMITKVNDSFSAYKLIMSDVSQDDQQLLLNLEEAWKAYEDTYKKTVSSSKNAMSTEAISEFMKDSEHSYAAIQTNIDYLVRNNHSSAEDASITARRPHRRSERVRSRWQQASFSSFY